MIDQLHDIVASDPRISTPSTTRQATALCLRSSCSPHCSVLRPPGDCFKALGPWTVVRACKDDPLWRRFPSQALRVTIHLQARGVPLQQLQARGGDDVRAMVLYRNYHDDYPVIDGFFVVEDHLVDEWC
ncbi:putative retrotransposon hot spot protein 4 (RHS4) [Trypanosoma vivax]|nr:putative retrotransposon hot spot protein 4 (RHS4) [Trypanosoma vivax]